MKMNLDEDLRPDREDEFQTDDEENQAQRACGNDFPDDDTDSQSDGSSRENLADGCNSNAILWPRSYRRSIDMLSSCTPPSLGFLRGSSASQDTSLRSAAYRRSFRGSEHQSLGRPFISLPVEDEDEAQSPTSLKLSVSEIPPPQQECSFVQSTLNGINVLCGIGILTVPYAIHQGGWSSLGLLFLISLISGYTGILLKRCLESSPGLKTYPDIGQAAFGTYGRIVIAIALYVDLFASCVEYIILMSDNLANLFPNVEADISGFHVSSQQFFAISCTLIILPTVWLRNLGVLSYLSVGGVAASILVVLCLLWLGTADQIGFHTNGTAINLVNLPFTLGIFGFCYSGHSVFPNIYSSMKEPSKFPVVIIASFGFCLFMYAGTAVCGFLMFGESIKSQFTLNMPTKFMASKIAVWTTVVNPMTKYALTIMPVALCLEELLPSPKRASYCIAIIIRTALTFSTLVVALTIPFFGFVMAMMGSVLAMLLALIFPAACCLRLLKGRLSKLEIGACWFTIVLGICSSIIGTYAAISQLGKERGAS